MEKSKLRILYDRLIQEDYWPVQIYHIISLYEFCEQNDKMEAFNEFMNKISRDYESETIAELTSFVKENIPYDLFLNDQISEHLNKNCLSIFLNLDKECIIENDFKRDQANKNTLATLAFDEYCVLLKEKTQLNLDCNNEIIESINKILELLKNIKLSELK